MKKFSILTLLVVLMLSLTMVFTACSSSDDDPPPPPGGGEAFSFTGPFVYDLYGNNKPVYDEATGLLSITAGSSTGFQVKFADIGYTYNAADTLVITYYVEVETPVAILTYKDPSDWSKNLNGIGGADWGKGKGVEYALGDEVRSVYDGPLVAGTYDPATKTGTIEVLVRLLSRATTGIGFQHNYWADDGGNGVKIAENSVYKLKFTKIENKVAEAFECDCDGDKTECGCGPDCECEVCEMPEVDSNVFDNAVGLKTLENHWGTSGQIVADATTGIISRNPGSSSLFSVGVPTGVTITSTDTIVVTYVGVVEEGAIKLTAKENGTSTDITPPTYLDLVGDGTIKTLTIPASRYATIPPVKLTFQDNSATSAVWKLKITGITVQ